MYTQVLGRNELNINNNLFKLLTFGIDAYILSILFNGIVCHIGLSIGILETIRPFLPEIFIIVIIAVWLKKAQRFQKYDLYLLLYILFICLLGLISGPSINTILGTFRDLVEPFVLLAVISTISLSNQSYNILMKHIRNIFSIFVIVGFFFALYQKIMGWEWTSKYFAGYTFYGISDDGSFRISQGWLGFKALGTTGSAESFGFYNALTVLYFLFFKFKNKFVNGILIVLSFTNIMLCGMKTPFLIAVIMVSLVILSKVKISKVTRDILVILIGFICLSYLIFGQGSWEDSSMYDRLVLWSQLFTLENIINLFVPYNVYTFSAYGVGGFASTWDNSYMYLGFSIGLIGLAFVIFVLLRKYKKMKKSVNGKFVSYLLLFLALASITTCIFMGRCCICVIFIILGLQMSKKEYYL